MSRCPRLDRRQCLALLLPLPALASCGPPPDRRVRVELAALEGGARVVVGYRAQLVEVRRAGDEIVATSLLCSHTGCKVHWDEARDQYVCACHEGRFDPAGRPVAGPPMGPLNRLKVAADAGGVLIGDP